MKQLLRFIVAFVVSVSLALPQAWAASATFTVMDPTGSYLPNPEKGRIYWAGSDVINNYDGTSVAAGVSAGWRLVMFKVSLSSYLSGNLDSTFLNNLQTRFNSVRSAGAKAVIWFAYDGFGGSGSDASISQITTHLNQLAPYFKANADVIAYFKAGFVGAYAEWWGSDACNANINLQGGCTLTTTKTNSATLRDALLAATHPTTFINFRYPADLTFWYPTVLAASEAYRGRKGRLTFHNDCPNSSDINTWATYTGSATVANQKTYAAALTNHAPFVGEFSVSCSGYTASCATTMSEAATYHATAFKTDYSGTPPSAGGDAGAFVNAWSTGGCFNEVYNRMGYFLQLKTLNHADSVSAGNSVTFTITARNVGWSRIHTERRLEVVLSKTGQTTFVCGRSMQLRALPAQDTSDRTLEVTCRVPGGTATGAWNVHLRIPDIWPNTKNVAAFAIRPANSDSGGQSWDATNFRFTTGTTLTVN